MIEPVRHVQLHPVPWDQDAVAQAIDEIVADASTISTVIGSGLRIPLMAEQRTATAASTSGLRVLFGRSNICGWLVQPRPISIFDLAYRSSWRRPKRR